MNINTEKDFEQLFRETLDKLEEDAKSVGSNLTELCREAGISRTTPDRWKAQAPITVRHIANLQLIVKDKLNAAAAAKVDK